MLQATPIKHKNLRLKNYNYSQAGYYFVTLCTGNRKNLLCSYQSTPKSENLTYGLSLTNLGIIADTHINNINSVYNNVKVDCYVIMPNHIHMLITLNPGSSIKLPNIINSYKTITSKKVGCPIWQKNYYEHIIRTEQELYDTRTYIKNNPLKWLEDEYYLK